MRYRRLGTTDVEVSVIGLGAISFGDPTRVASPADSEKIIHAALDHGITFIDTGDAYGHGASEDHIGRALEGRRDQAVIATKVKLSDASEGDHREGESVRERIMRSIDASLTRLRTDHVDLYQIHHPEPDISHEEILEPLDELVRAGKVRHIGEANYAAWRHAQANAVAERRGWARLISAQGYYNLMRRHVEPELLTYCTANKVSFIPYRPLANGWLSGKYADATFSPTSSNKTSKRIARLAGDERRRTMLRELTAFAEARGHTILELAFAWLLAHPAVTTVIAGATSAQQVVANAAAADWVLTLEERDAVDAIAAWDGSGEEVEEPGRHTIGRPRR